MTSFRIYAHLESQNDLEYENIVFETQKLLKVSSRIARISHSNSIQSSERHCMQSNGKFLQAPNFNLFYIQISE